MQLTHDILTRLDQLEQKFAAMGQDMQSYLDGLLQADYLTYWDYIQLDTLLCLQNARTPIADERIFILYHQITELYFRLILDAMESAARQPTLAHLTRQLSRINRYFEQLIQSFDIMVEGMDKTEFLQFRMALLPASGFQSAQFRQIEIWSTDFTQLVHADQREALRGQSIAQQYEALYWKRGATELATNNKTLTLKQFELKYAKTLCELAETVRDSNLWRCYTQLSEDDKQSAEGQTLKKLLREHDLNVNVRWRLSHFRSAVRHLDRQPQTIAATGGTNWQQYLPPRHQRVIFFPQLWTSDELDAWGTKVQF
jgi:tryptophan 2,3-dioxygenase